MFLKLIGCYTLFDVIMGKYIKLTLKGYRICEFEMKSILDTLPRVHMPRPVYLVDL